MDAATTIYEERLRLADSINDYKRFFTEPHCKLLVGEALKATPEGSERLEYIVALGRRCKTGLVSADQLAEQVNEAYSLRPMLQQEEGDEEKGERGGGDDVDDNEGANKDEEEDDEEEDEKEDEEEEDEEEEEADDEVKDLFATHEGDFCTKRRWRAECLTFTLPGEEYWLDAHHIKLFRTSTYEDFATATPKPMPVYINDNPWAGRSGKITFETQAKSYHLCKKVAVSFEGNIYRATDGEIEAALAKTKDAPMVDAATYVKLARETRRRHAIERARESGRGGNANGPKRRRVHVAT